MGNDTTLIGSGNADTIRVTSGAGNDTLDGSAASVGVTLYGGSGTDIGASQFQIA